MRARDPENPDRFVNLGVLQATSVLWPSAGLFTQLGQYHGIIQSQLVGALHLFRGVRRGLSLGDDMNADRRVLAYVLAPDGDWVCTGSADGVTPLAVPKPDRSVYVVLVNQYAEVDTDGASGSIEEFNWVDADPRDATKPVNYDVRYKEHLWSRR